MLEAILQYSAILYFLTPIVLPVVGLGMVLILKLGIWWQDRKYRKARHRHV